MVQDNPASAVPSRVPGRPVSLAAAPDPEVGPPCPAPRPRTGIGAPGNAGATAPTIAAPRGEPPGALERFPSPSGSPSIAGAGGPGPDRGTRQDVESALSPHGRGVSAPRLTREAQGSLLGAPTRACGPMARRFKAKLKLVSPPRPEQAETARACFFAYFLARQESRSPAAKRAKPDHVSTRHDHQADRRGIHAETKVQNHPAECRAASPARKIYLADPTSGQPAATATLSARTRRSPATRSLRPRAPTRAPRHPRAPPARPVPRNRPPRPRR